MLYPANYLASLRRKTVRSLALGLIGRCPTEKQNEARGGLDQCDFQVRTFPRGERLSAEKGPRVGARMSRILASLVAVVALVMSASAWPRGERRSFGQCGHGRRRHQRPVSYEADCTTSFEAGQVAPFATTLDGNTTIDSGAPTGATFGFTGTATTTIVGAFIAALYTNGVGANPLTLKWIETIGSTDGQRHRFLQAHHRHHLGRPTAVAR